MATNQEIEAAKERYSAAKYESDSKGDLTLHGSHIHELDQRLLADAFCEQQSILRQHFTEPWLDAPDGPSEQRC